MSQARRRRIRRRNLPPVPVERMWRFLEDHIDLAERSVRLQLRAEHDHATCRTCLLWTGRIAEARS